MLVRRIILAIVLLGIAGLAYYGYKSWMTRRAMMSGDVYSDAVDSVTTTLKQAAAAPANPPPVSTPSTNPSAPSASGSTTANPAQPINPASQPASSGNDTRPPDAGRMQPSFGQASQSSTAASPPSYGRDTIRTQPPNGTVFAGSGHYQIYRQGNLTWRLNTDTGSTCVLFATEQEWRKPQVYRNGCATNPGR